MHPTNIQFIYFDLDDTLLDHRRAERRGLEDVYRAHEVHFQHVTIAAVQDTYHSHSVPLWQQYAQGAIGKHDLQRLRFQNTLDSLGINTLEAESLNAFYLGCYSRHWVLTDEARVAFHTLADHFPVGILTNGFSEVQHAKFDRFPELRDRSDVLIISEETGYMKPHPELFAYAAAAAGVPAETILYVGDSYTSDVQGALQAGWQSAWYTTRSDQQTNNVFRFEEWERLTNCLLENAT